MRGRKGMADGGWALVLFRMRPQGIGDGGHDLRPQPYPPSGMVCRGLVHDQPEAWGKCARVAAPVGTGELSNRLDHVTEVAHGNGAARPGSSLWFRRSR